MRSSQGIYVLREQIIADALLLMRFVLSIGWYLIVFTYLLLHSISVYDLCIRVGAEKSTELSQRPESVREPAEEEQVAMYRIQRQQHLHKRVRSLYQTEGREVKDKTAKRQQGNRRIMLFIGKPKGRSKMISNRETHWTIKMKDIGVNLLDTNAEK